MRSEGPFGEFTGYYGRPEAGCPLVKVNAVHYRTKPDPDQRADGRLSIVRAERLLRHRPLGPHLGRSGQARHARHQGRVLAPGRPRAASAWPSSACEQRYAGHAAQALALAAQVPGRRLLHQVDHRRRRGRRSDRHGPGASGRWPRRCNPIEDIDILRNTWCTWLDPTQNPPEERPYGSKALINACKEHRYLPVFSKRTAIRHELYEKISREWKELGLDGEPPRLLAFHQEDHRKSLVEAKEFDHDNGAGGQGGERNPDAFAPGSGNVTMSM